MGKLQAATTNGLVSTFSIVGLLSPSNSPVRTTNVIGNVITSTYTSKPLTMNTKSILDLLEVEFGTQFPAGARLAYGLGTSGFMVLDSTGNVLLNAATNTADTNYSFVLSNSVTYLAVPSGKAVQTTTADATNTVTVATEHLPDYGIYYQDGKSNKFHFNGMVTLKLDELETSTNDIYKTVSIQLNGFGGGTVFNPASGEYDEAVFTSATWNASGVNIPE
ncbi:MAG: hypothetical protein ABSA83_03985 [Verrucomicrobiota bacterium]